MKNVAKRAARHRLPNTLFFLTLLVFIIIAGLVQRYPQNIFDSFIQNLCHPMAAPSTLPFWIRITFFGSFEFLFPAYIIFILIRVWLGKARFGLSVEAVGMGGFLSVQLLKEAFHRHRPFKPLIPNVTDYSFPSGHSTSSLIFFGVLAYSLWHSSLPRLLRISAVSLLVLAVLLIGLSRVILNVHYPSDVAAGFCFGTLWTIAWYRFIKRDKIVV